MVSHGFVESVLQIDSFLYTVIFISEIRGLVGNGQIFKFSCCFFYYEYEKV